MSDQRDRTVCEAWEFLVPHPEGGLKPLYVKIGLHGNTVRINLISLHIDRPGDLLSNITAYHRNR
ncbi:hypothetical protein BH23VER1_BH23VER1_29950 [soil metagenome]